jgi:hypothetical protein
MRASRFIAAALAVAATLAGATALAAAKVGDSIWVKARNAKVMATSAPTADVVEVLQPGDEVKWFGADPGNPKWHRVQLKDGKKGVLFLSDLSPTKPAGEITSSGAEVDAKSFASSGAATKALGEGAIEYGKSKDMGKDVDQLQGLEKLAKGVSVDEAAQHAAAAGLFPVVGSVAESKSAGGGK